MARDHEAKKQEGSSFEGVSRQATGYSSIAARKISAFVYKPDESEYWILLVRDGRRCVNDISTDEPAPDRQILLPTPSIASLVWRTAFQSRAGTAGNRHLSLAHDSRALFGV